MPTSKLWHGLLDDERSRSLAACARNVVKRDLSSKGALLLLTLTTGSVVLAADSTVLTVPPTPELTSLLTAGLALLIPIGLTLMAVGASPEKRAVDVALMALIALCLGIIGYALVGFGFQFGGIGLVSNLEGVEGLIREWSPLDVAWGPGWGALGLDAFFILGKDYNAGILTLFLSQVVLAVTAVLIPALALAGRVKYPALILTILLVSMVTYPVLGNWAWGGGWLANLGINRELGHGFVDSAGTMVYAIGGMTALAGLLAFGIKTDEEKRKGPATLPPTHFPLLMILGALLTIVGWLGLAMGNPFTAQDVSSPLILINVLMAAAGGAILSVLYTWFATGRPDPLLTARGTVAGLVAISASCAFVPTWASLAIGSVAGLILPLGTYLVERVLCLDDTIGAIATHGLAGIWGLLALGLFADGHHGAGWNGVGAAEYLGIEGQGVSGAFIAPGFQPDFPRQLHAQITGVAAIIVLALLSWLLFKWLNKVFAPRVTVEPTPSEHEKGEAS